MSFDRQIVFTCGEAERVATECVTDRYRMRGALHTAETRVKQLERRDTKHRQYLAQHRELVRAHERLSLMYKELARKYVGALGKLSPEQKRELRLQLGKRF